jgi:hypothetical protein
MISRLARSFVVGAAFNMQEAGWAVRIFPIRTVDMFEALTRFSVDPVRTLQLASQTRTLAGMSASAGEAGTYPLQLHLATPASGQRSCNVLADRETPVSERVFKAGAEEKCLGRLDHCQGLNHLSRYLTGVCLDTNFPVC